jgi:ubiquinone/menaquinone biosynthesis C-methylase UbiE
MSLSHKICGGKIVEIEMSNPTSLQFVCLKCGNKWGILSDFTDIEVLDFHKQKANRLTSSIEFHKVYWRARAPNFWINFLFNDRLRNLIKLLSLSKERPYSVLDIGCKTGYFAQFLAQQVNGLIIGIDVNKQDLYRAKVRERLKACYAKPMSLRTVDLVCSSVTHLPFKENCLDMVVCASVLEHISDLEGAIRCIDYSTKKTGTLLAGYPLETRLFKSLLRLFMPRGLIIRDPTILGMKKFKEAPETHKQSFVSIRSVLQKYFTRSKEIKSPLTILPDEVCWYECVELKKRKSQILK